MSAFAAFAGIAFSGEVARNLLKDFEKVAVKLIRETGGELKGVITHSGNTTDKLICRFADEASGVMEFAIDRAAGKVELLAGHIAGHTHLLIQKAGEEARLCIDMLQKNVAWSWVFPVNLVSCELFLKEVPMVMSSLFQPTLGPC